MPMPPEKDATAPRTVRLHDIAHSRAGDKGDRLNLSLFAYDPRHYDVLVAGITENRLFELFEHRGVTRVRRYLLPQLSGMNFVIDGVLEGGVNGSINLDGHGKTLSYRLLGVDVELDDFTCRQAPGSGPP